MSLLIPAGLIASILALAWLMGFRKSRHLVNDIAGLLWGLAGLAGVGAIGYGIYTWLRFGAFDSVSVARVVAWIDPHSLLLGATGWAGIDQLSTWYLHSDIAWTLIGTAVVGMQAWDWVPGPNPDEGV